MFLTLRMYQTRRSISILYSEVYSVEEIDFDQSLVSLKNGKTFNVAKSARKIIKKANMNA